MALSEDLDGLYGSSENESVAHATIYLFID